jgi:N-hydroxyarylamine O-acetyltransferase
MNSSLDESPAIDVTRYLERIGYRGSHAPTAATLRTLHLAHLQTVPFENLDIPLGRRIALDEPTLFAKIVGRQRGGFCFELNILFAALLRRLGFGVTLLAAQFPRGETDRAPEFDHLALLVETPVAGERWLADVGAGRGGFALPLRADTRAEQPQPAVAAIFRLVDEGDAHRLLRRSLGQTWERSYRFSRQPRTVADFAAGCHYYQTSPDSHFTRGRLCSRLTPTGRITLADHRLITTVHGERRERILADEAAERAVLRRDFGITLEE